MQLAPSYHVPKGNGASKPAPKACGRGAGPSAARPVKRPFVQLGAERRKCAQVGQQEAPKRFSKAVASRSLHPESRLRRDRLRHRCCREWHWYRDMSGASSIATSFGSETFLFFAAIATAASKQADQPAAKKLLGIGVRAKGSGDLCYLPEQLRVKGTVILAEPQPDTGRARGSDRRCVCRTRPAAGSRRRWCRDRLFGTGARRSRAPNLPLFEDIARQHRRDHHARPSPQDRSTPRALVPCRAPPPRQTEYA